MSDPEFDTAYMAAVGLMVLTRRASTSHIQHVLLIPYSAAARLVERMQIDGIVSLPNAVGKREVLVQKVVSPTIDDGRHGLEAAQTRFPCGTPVWLKFPDGAKPDRKTKVNSAPFRVPTGRMVVGVDCSTSCVGIDRIRER